MTHPTLPSASPVHRLFGPGYPPFLQEAVDHAERLVHYLEAVDPATGRATAATWLVGRSEEIECFVATFVQGWRRGEATEREAARSVNAYLQALHQAVATQFAELAPSCCGDGHGARRWPARALATTVKRPLSTIDGSESVTSTAIDEVCSDLHEDALS
jgi:hypothetical protein